MDERIIIVVKKLMAYANQLDELARSNPELPFLEKRKVIEKNFIFRTFTDVFVECPKVINKQGLEIHPMDVVYLRPDLVISYLKEIDSLLEDKSLFMEWYLSGLVEFYLKGYKYYCGVVAVYDIDKNSIGVLESEIKLLAYSLKGTITKLCNNQTLNFSYSSKKEIFKKMFSLKKEKGISYLHQNRNLERLSLDTLFLSRLPRIKNNVVNEDRKNLISASSKKRKEKEKQERLHSFVVVKEEKIYNRCVLEGRVLEEVLYLLNDFYPSFLVSSFKKQILENNKELLSKQKEEQEVGKEEVYNRALDTILGEDSRSMKPVFMELKAWCKTENLVPLWLGYLPELKEWIAILDMYVNQFIERNDTILVPDYYDYIEAIYNSLEEECLPYLPLTSYTKKEKL